jgi:hypothetical protein
MRAVEETGKSTKKVDSMASTWLEFFEGLLLREAKKTLGKVNVKVSEVETVFGPLCNTAYVVFRTTGTPGVRATAQPVMVTSSYNVASQYVIQSVAGSVIKRTKSPSYYVTYGLVRFFSTPDQVTSYMYAMSGD